MRYLSTDRAQYLVNCDSWATVSEGTADRIRIRILYRSTQVARRVSGRASMEMRLHRVDPNTTLGRLTKPSRVNRKTDSHRIGRPVQSAIVKNRSGESEGHG